jgi:glycolate oxidase FAD binding subunit
MTTTTMERPTTVADAAAVLRNSTGTVLFRGAGTKAGWAGRVRNPDLVLETGGLNRLLNHNPADMTVAVEAGMRLADLQRELASSGQWLALDPPTEAAGATIGGLLATGDSGPRRLRYGALRDLVIGVTLVLADGTVAHAGGHVIKNVAGYDLTKLCYGSLGVLGLIAEVVLRVHPLPETTATVVGPASGPEAAEATLAVLASSLEPSAVDRVDGRLAVRFEGAEAGVQSQIAGLRPLLGAAGPRMSVLTGPDESALWQEFAAAGRAAAGESVVFAGALPDRLTAIAQALTEAADGAVDETAVAARLCSHTALGLHTARFSGPLAGQARAIRQWRDAVLRLGGTVLLRDRPDGLDVDPLGPPPSAVHLLRAVKARLDPHGRCAPGRLRPWL